MPISRLSAVGMGYSVIWPLAGFGTADLAAEPLGEPDMLAVVGQVIGCAVGCRHVVFGVRPLPVACHDELADCVGILHRVPNLICPQGDDIGRLAARGGDGVGGDESGRCVGRSHGRAAKKQNSGDQKRGNGRDGRESSYLVVDRRFGHHICSFLPRTMALSRYR